MRRSFTFSKRRIWAHWASSFPPSTRLSAHRGAANWSRYPPEAHRSAGGGQARNVWGKYGPYRQTFNDNMLVLVMIENPDSLSLIVADPKRSHMGYVASMGPSEAGARPGGDFTAACLGSATAVEVPRDRVSGPKGCP